MFLALFPSEGRGQDDDDDDSLVTCFRGGFVYVLLTKANENLQRCGDAFFVIFQLVRDTLTTFYVVGLLRTTKKCA